MKKFIHFFMFVLRWDHRKFLSIMEFWQTIRDSCALIPRRWDTNASIIFMVLAIARRHRTQKPWRLSVSFSSYYTRRTRIRDTRIICIFWRIQNFEIFGATILKPLTLKIFTFFETTISIFSNLKILLFLKLQNYEICEYSKFCNFSKLENFGILKTKILQFLEPQNFEIFRNLKILEFLKQQKFLNSQN